MSTDNGTQPEKTQAMDDGAITFLDVLGWKGIWTREVGAAPIAKLKRVIQAAREAVEPVLQEVLDHCKSSRGMTAENIRVECISDTIVLIARGAPEPTLWVNARICQEIVCRSIEESIPVRGATCYGRYQADDEERIMVGPAVDEAASWHEELDWIGVVQTPCAHMYCVDSSIAGLVIYDQIPAKNVRCGSLYCVDWTGRWGDLHPEGARSLRSYFGSMGPLDTSIAGKYLNTLAFYEQAVNTKKATTPDGVG